MPTELWDLDEWPSPAPEAVVRARVRGRARSILRLRVAVAAVAASLAVVVGLTDLPAPGSGVKMRESRWQPADQPVEDEGEAENSAPVLEPPAVVRAIDAAPAVMAPPAAPVEAAEPTPVAELLRGPTVPDAVGDARYQTCRGVECPPETDLERGSPSQAPFDFASVGLLCSASVYEGRLTFADLDAAPTPNRAGLTPTYGLFHVGLQFQDAQRTMITLGVQHDLVSEWTWSGGTVSVFDGEEYRSTFLKSRVRRVGEAFAVEITRQEMAAAFTQAWAEAVPPPVGTPFDTSAVSMAVYRNPVQTSDVVDQIPVGGPGTTARWCD